MRLVTDLAGDGADTGDILARAVVAGDQADFHWIRADREDDRDGRCGGLGRARRSDVAGGANHGDLEVDQLGGERRQLAIVALAPAIFDPDILAFDETDVPKTLSKRRRVELVQLG